MATALALKSSRSSIELGGGVYGTRRGDFAPPVAGLAADRIENIRRVGEVAKI